MELIFSAALCSVLVSMLLKWTKQKGFDALQMIAWNYAIASVLSYIWFTPDLAHISISNTPWWLILALVCCIQFICYLIKNTDLANFSGVSLSANVE